ncbi:MAG: M12 family metallo-peptidase, partial [Saprospiraceae bacterium]|nr:M12 family metallo-peptidase [Saprospiraceae bacterium]
MKHTYVIVLWLCLWVIGSVAAQGQTGNRIAEALKNKTNQRSKEAIPVFDLFNASKPSADHARHQSYVENSTALQFRAGDARRLVRLQPDIIELDIPFGTDTLKLQVFAQSPLTSSFLARSSDGLKQERQGAHYRGVINGDDQSIVAISIFNDEVIGILSSSELGNVIIGKSKVSEDHLIYREDDLLISAEPICQMLEVPNRIPSEKREINNQQRSVAECVQVYFETSYSLYQSKGSFAAVQNYVTGLFNGVATLYANEGLNVEISEIFIWTSNDPFSHGSSSAAINSFISERPNFNGTVGHLLDISGGNNGGLGYVDVLCSSSFNVAYSDINASYSNFPTYSWTVNVVTHELGHNFGSQHTHDCVWGPSNCTAIDGCSRPNASVGCGSCADAPIPPKGTIMSYCHVGGNGIDFNLGFGSEPGNLIRSRAAAANCLAQCGSGNGGGGCTLFIDDVVVSNATCSDNNGKVSVFISGESGSVSYDIGNGPQSSNTFSKLAAGGYTVTVTNGAGCGRSETATVAMASEQPGLAATVTNATCGQSDGIVELSASAGTSPYSYRIGSKTQSSPIFNNMAVGNYKAIVTDDNGCTESKQLAIFTDNPPAL